MCNDAAFFSLSPSATRTPMMLRPPTVAPWREDARQRAGPQTQCNVAVCTGAEHAVTAITSTGVVVVSRWQLARRGGPSIDHGSISMQPTAQQLLVASVLLLLAACCCCCLLLLLLLAAAAAAAACCCCCRRRRRRRRRRCCSGSACCGQIGLQRNKS